MLVDIEKYVIQGRMDSASIYLLLKHDYGRIPNPLWIVKLRLDPVSRKLKSLLWMSPTQKELYNKYNDVTIIDTTYNTNRFQMMLCIISCISPGVIFTDSDPSMIQSIKEIYNQLIDQYPAAAKYLSDTLYINKKKSWAIPWIHKRFTTEAQSTQRIESINRHIHDKVNRATSLYDLLLNIKDHVRNEEHFEYFELERNAIPQLSVCYDINRITEWQNLINVEIDNKEISNGIREQEQDVRQILFKSLIKNIPPEAILEECRWYLDINIQLDNLSPISVYGTQTEDRVGMKKSITFQHFFSFWVDSHVSNLAIKLTKAIYAELFGLSKKAIDCALKANMQHELMNLLKSFIYDIYNKNVKIQETQETFTDINNPAITKHKG
ncbi:unnamed protein product [Rhizophagus irregularis]|nr:unnamed protein product [Rhizophagus irregularis]